MMLCWPAGGVRGLLPLSLALMLLSGCSLGIPASADSASSGEGLADPWGYVAIPKERAIKIAIAADFSGPYSDLGRSIERGVKLALNEQGAIKKASFELVVEDDRCDDEHAASVANKLTLEPEVAGVVGHMCRGAILSARPIYDQAKMVMITPSSVADEVTAPGFPVVFRTSWNDLVQGQAAASYAVNELGSAVAAIVHDGSSYGRAVAEEFRRHYEGASGQVVAVEEISTMFTPEIGPLLARLASLKPDIIYFGGIAKEGVFLLRGMKEAGFTPVFMGGDGLFDQKDFIAAAGEAAEGAYVTVPRFPQGPSYLEWQERFETSFRQPPDGFSAQAYDATKLLLSAIDKAAVRGKDGTVRIGRKAVADALRNADYEGLTGRITFDDRGDRSGAQVEMHQVADGKFRELSVVTLPQPQGAP